MDKALGASRAALDDQLWARLEWIELISALGVLVLGVGLGVLFAVYLARMAAELVVVGIAVHGWDMFGLPSIS